MNWLDRAIGAVEPEAGLRRARRRHAMAVIARAYEGARAGRRPEGWITAGTDASAEIAPALARLRDRSRDLVRNNPYAAKAVQALVSNMVGTGLLPRARAADAEIAGLADRLWLDFSASADADGLTDFSSLQALMVRSLVESGEVLVRLRERRSEVLVRLRERRSEDGLPVPLQLQVLEADHLDGRSRWRRCGASLPSSAAIASKPPVETPRK
jgi:capsid protein